MNTPRVWGGSTLDARRSARRERLIEAGFELLGGPGGAPAVTVRSVCRTAKLTDRYFYENFADRNELVLAVYDQVGDEARQTLTEAVGSAMAGAAGKEHDPSEIARVAVRAFVGRVTDDPRKGRVLLLAPMTDAVLSERALALQPAFGELIRLQLAATVRPPGAPGSAGEPAPAGESGSAGEPGPTGEPDEQAQWLTAAALIGALSNLFVRWLDGSLAVSADELTEYCVRMLVHAVPLSQPG
jgi:AcrR family transcriptional regulator